MVNILSFYISILQNVMKLLGMQPKEVEIEPNTVIHFWAPFKTNKKKPSLVLLHGFAGDGLLTWQFYIISLSKNYNLYVPDLLFFGKSYSNRSERSTRFQADCMAIGLKKLGVEKCIIVGFSYGGCVGFKLAEHYPKLVCAMVVTDTFLAWTESLNNRALEKIGATSLVEILMPKSVEGVEKLLKAGSYQFPPMPNFFYKHFLQIMFGNRKERTELLEALVVKNEDVTTHQFQQRIHMIWGNEDQLLDIKDAKNLKKRLGEKTTLKVVKKAGHLALLERPFVFNKYLTELLGSL